MAPLNPAAAEFRPFTAPVAFPLPPPPMFIQPPPFISKPQKKKAPKPNPRPPIYTSPRVRKCAACDKTENSESEKFEACSSCPKTLYCSTECKTSDWENAHKAVCNSRVINLVDLPQNQVFGYLIDCFRLRLEDEYRATGDAAGLYAGDNPRPPFKDFLHLAEARNQRHRGFLPTWWNKNKRFDCIKAASKPGVWASIDVSVEASDIVEHYKDEEMPRKLRELGDKIYGNSADGFGFKYDGAAPWESRN